MSLRIRIALSVLLLLASGVNVGFVVMLGSIGQTFLAPSAALAVALMTPALITVIWLLWKPGRRVMGVYAGLGAFGAFTAMTAGSFLFLGAWNPGDGGRVMKFVALLTLPNLVALVAGLVVAFKEFGRGAIGDGMIGFGIAVLMQVGAGVVGTFASFGVSMGANLSYGSKSARIDRILRRVQSCAFKYSESRPDGAYPSTLSVVGSTGTGCLDASAEGELRALSVRYVAEGTPPRSFGVIARSSVVDGNDIGGVADTSGMLRTYEMPADTSLIVRGADDIVRMISTLRNCALAGRHLGRSATVPQTMAELMPMGRDDGDALRLECAYASGNATKPSSDDSFTDREYRFTYRASGPSEFTIEARPLGYGLAGVNSYLLRETGLLHRTTSDRAATQSDPTIPACRYADSIKVAEPMRCAWLALPRRDVPLQIVRPAEVGFREQFIVSVRDPADTSKAPDGAFWVSIMCNVTEANTRYMKSPNGLGRRLDERCSSYSARPEPIVLMLFVRDTAGAVGWKYDTVRVAGSP